MDEGDFNRKTAAQVLAAQGGLGAQAGKAPVLVLEPKNVDGYSWELEGAEERGVLPDAIGAARRGVAALGLYCVDHEAALIPRHGSVIVVRAGSFAVEAKATGLFGIKNIAQDKALPGEYKNVGDAALWAVRYRDAAPVHSDKPLEIPTILTLRRKAGELASYGRVVMRGQGGAVLAHQFEIGGDSAHEGHGDFGDFRLILGTYSMEKGGAPTGVLRLVGFAGDGSPYEVAALYPSDKFEVFSGLVDGVEFTLGPSVRKIKGVLHEIDNPQPFKDFVIEMRKVFAETMARAAAKRASVKEDDQKQIPGF